MLKKKMKKERICTVKNAIAGRKYKTIIIYDLHDEQNKERRNERQRTEEMVKPFPRLYVLPIFVFMNSERSEL